MGIDWAAHCPYRLFANVEPGGNRGKFMPMAQLPLPPRGVNRPDRLAEIQIDTLREERDNPGLTTVRGALSLRQLLDKYTLTLGLQNAHLLEVLTTLLTTGKVRVEFRSYNERLQLLSFSDAMSRPAAVELFNDYLVSSKEKKLLSAPEGTRRITVQLPKIVIDDPGATRRAPPVP